MSTTRRITVFVSAFTPRLRSNRSAFHAACIRTEHRNQYGPPSGSRGLAMSTDSPVPRAAGVVNADLKEELSRSYLEYAMSVIMGRAMPDVRDGLKPVHRRILYAMHDLGLNPTSQFRKSARVVGEVLGKYHPHGDSAVYDALVRMAQSFSMCAPLIDGHGNFGSTDGDPAAAMRYTECRLTPMTRDVLFADIGKDTVEFAFNFDGSEREPLVLPSRLPNLLLNGSSGIAVGLATNIPPHNLNELSNALIALIANPDLSDEKLLDLVPGPDFPTGALILGKAGARDMYLRGKGQIVMRARAHKETVTADVARKASTRAAIVITELPYQVNKANLIAKIAELVNTKKLEGVADLRDESDRSGTRIVVELKRDVNESLVMNNLFKKTDLQTSFSANVMALDSGQFPVLLTLRTALMKFLDFRRETVRKRTAFDLKTAQAREHLVDGFLVVQKHCDKVVRTIRGSKDPAEAKYLVMELCGLSELQADSILSMQLRRLTSLEQRKLELEKEDLTQRIAEYTGILGDSSKVDAIIRKELKVLAQQYSVERRSVILEAEGGSTLDIDEKSLVPNEHSVIVVTEQGYMKRMAVNSFEAQHRNTKGKRGLGRLRENDMLMHCVKCRAHDKLLVVTKNGQAYELPAHKVPKTSLTARGVPVFQLLPDIEAGMGMAAVVPVSSSLPDEYLVLLTQDGLCLKTELSQFESFTCKGKRIMTISDDDELRWVRRCQPGDSVLISSENGRAMRVTSDDIPQRNRGARGVRTMKLRAGERIAGMDVMPAGSEQTAFALLVSSRGAGKRLPLESLQQKSRRIMGRQCIRLVEGERVVSLHVCNESDSVMLATKHGTIMRQRVSRIFTKGLRAKGVALQKLDGGDSIGAVTIIPKELAVDEQEEENSEALLGDDEEATADDMGATR